MLEYIWFVATALGGEGALVCVCKEANRAVRKIRIILPFLKYEHWRCISTYDRHANNTWRVFFALLCEYLDYDSSKAIGEKIFVRLHHAMKNAAWWSTAWPTLTYDGCIDRVRIEPTENNEQWLRSMMLEWNGL